MIKNILLSLIIFTKPTSIEKDNDLNYTVNEEKMYPFAPLNKLSILSRFANFSDMSNINNSILRNPHSEGEDSEIELIIPKDLNITQNVRNK